METTFGMIMSILGFLMSFLMYFIVIALVVCVAAYYTKPSEKSLGPYARQWTKKSALRQKAKGLVNSDAKAKFQDFIVFRLAMQDEDIYLGLFGAWFNLGAASEWEDD